MLLKSDLKTKEKAQWGIWQEKKIHKQVNQNITREHLVAQTTDLFLFSFNIKVPNVPNSL